MAHVETGHIHLGDSILHHTEGWETKKKKKSQDLHENTRTDISTPAHMHACAQTHTQPTTNAARPQCHEHERSCSLGIKILKAQKNKRRVFRHTHTLSLSLTHTLTHRDTWSTFQPKMMKYEMEHYHLEWQSARDCAGPLSHCLLLPKKEKREKRRRRNS